MIIAILHIIPVMCSVHNCSIKHCSGDEMEEKQQLDEQMRAVMDKYKYKRRQIRELQEDLQTMSHTLDNLSRDEDAYVEMIEEKQVGDSSL